MNLKNGYKVMYEVIEDGKRTFLASKTGVFADAEEIASFEFGAYKTVYQTVEGLFGRTKDGADVRLEAFDKVFVETVEDEGTVTPEDTTETTDEPIVPDEPETPSEEPDEPVEGDDDEPTDGDDEPAEELEV